MTCICVQCQTNALLEKNSCSLIITGQRRRSKSIESHTRSVRSQIWPLSLCDGGPGNVPFNKAADNGKRLQHAPFLLDLCWKCIVPSRYLSKPTTIGEDGETVLYLQFLTDLETPVLFFLNSLLPKRSLEIHILSYIVMYWKCCFNISGKPMDFPNFVQWIKHFFFSDELLGNLLTMLWQLISHAHNGKYKLRILTILKLKRARIKE